MTSTGYPTAPDGRTFPAPPGAGSGPVVGGPDTARRRGWFVGTLRRAVRPRAGTPRWERPALVAVLVATAVLYVVGLGLNGYANAFYSAAVQAGSTNWEAFFYGSSDAGNSITVDKPPASLWIMDLSVRLFGLSSWSILVPEAIMGVVTVALVYAIVRRRFSAGAALVAAGVLATTPVATLMFRFNNPDALLTMLLVLAIWFTLKGIESGRVRWLAWAGAMIGFAFLTKQLQGFLIIPALVGVYLYAAPVRLWTRIWHLLVAAAAIVVAAGWWVAIVELVPSGSRPYVGGSQDDSFLELTFGYNGLGRVTGDETGSVTGGGGSTTGGTFGMWGATGITRLFGTEFAGQISWLMPAAILLIVSTLVVLGFRRRTNPARATFLLFAASFVVTYLVFSFAGGIFHPYYTIALAPYIAGIVGIGSAVLWRRRSRLWVRIVAAVVVLVSAAWSWELLSEATGWQPWIKVVVVVCGVAAAVLLLLPVAGPRAARAALAGPVPRSGAAPRAGARVIAVAAGATTLVAVLIGPAAYSVQTVTTAHTGSLPSAGPSVAGAGFGGGRGGFAGRGGFGGGTFTRPGGTGGTGTFQRPGGGTFAPPGGTTGGTGTGTTGGAGRAFGGTGGFGGRGGFGGGNSLLRGSTSISSSLTKLLQADAAKYTWVAAAIGSNSAASYQLATQDAVMPIGGFNGSDPSPTLAEFKADVAAGRIHYFIAGSVGRSNGGSSASASISAWVEANFDSQTVGGVTLYDLSAPTS